MCLAVTDREDLLWFWEQVTGLSEMHTLTRVGGSVAAQTQSSDHVLLLKNPFGGKKICIFA